MEILNDDTCVKDVQASYGRCLANGDVIQTFYNNFLMTSDQVTEKFKHTDFESQKKLLRHGINLMIMYADDNIAGMAGLKRIQQSHSRRGLNITSNFYQSWKMSLLKALEQHDRKFDEDIRNKWGVVLDKGIAFIAEGY